MRILAASAWLLVPISLWLAVSVWGTPHVMLSYRYEAAGGQYVPRAQRQHTVCTYWGVTGSVTILPYGARCLWVRLLKLEG